VLESKEGWGPIPHGKRTERILLGREEEKKPPPFAVKKMDVTPLDGLAEVLRKEKRKNVQRLKGGETGPVPPTGERIETLNKTHKLREKRAE